MKRLAPVAAWVMLFAVSGAAQEAATPPTATKGTVVIGCLAGPDADDHYTLTSMQHRLGVEVVGGEELKKGAGAKVKLTGSWDAVPGSAGKKGDAARFFKATEMAVVDEKCETPAPITPVSKKKQQAQQQQKK
jgi:hypothetical protein